jgi:hypothetical protein
MGEGFGIAHCCPLSLSLPLRRLLNMRYWWHVAYFHLTDGKQVLSNHKGIDLSGNAAAREDGSRWHAISNTRWSWRAGTGPVDSSPSWISFFTRNQCREFSVDFLRPLAQSLFSARVPIAPAPRPFEFSMPYPIRQIRGASDIGTTRRRKYPAQFPPPPLANRAHRHRNPLW